MAREVEEEVEDNVAAPNTLSSDSWGDSDGSPTMNLYNYYSLLGHAITWECVIAVTVQVYFKYDAI
jgi:hypothetical protein